MPTQEYHVAQHDQSTQQSEVERHDVCSHEAAQGAPPELVSALLRQRFSCRYFTPQVPSESIVKAILEDARHAPSGSNFQPWRIHVVQGARKAHLTEQTTKAFRTESEGHQAPYVFYPENHKLLWDEYKHIAKRRADFGKAFFGPLQIDRADKEARRRLTERNWAFFDAPIAFLVTTLDIAPTGSYLDVGFLVMSILLSARAYGLEACVQEAHATFHGVYAKELSLDKTESVVCGVALGYPDWARIQQLSGKQSRMTMDELAVFHS